MASYRHSAYALRREMVVYPWHPFFGMVMQVVPYRRGKHFKLIITDLMPGYCREVPLWMLDAEYCGSMTQSAPEISIDGLTKLANCWRY